MTPHFRAKLCASWTSLPSTYEQPTAQFLCSVDRASRYNSCKWPTWYTILFSYMFISVLYIFWATPCSSSGESIVSKQHLVHVTLSGWRLVSRSGRKFLTCILDGHPHRVTYTRWSFDTIDSPHDEHSIAQNM